MIEKNPDDAALLHLPARAEHLDSLEEHLNISARLSRALWELTGSPDSATEDQRTHEAIHQLADIVADQASAARFVFYKESEAEEQARQKSKAMSGASAVEPDRSPQFIGRLSDTDHLDALDDMRNRVCGLRLAIEGLREEIGPEDFNGLWQLTDDVANAMTRCKSALQDEGQKRLMEGGR